MKRKIISIVLIVAIISSGYAGWIWYRSLHPPVPKPKSIYHFAPETPTLWVSSNQFSSFTRNLNQLSFFQNIRSSAFREFYKTRLKRLVRAQGNTSLGRLSNLQSRIQKLIGERAYLYLPNNKNNSWGNAVFICNLANKPGFHGVNHTVQEIIQQQIMDPLTRNPRINQSKSYFENVPIHGLTLKGKSIPGMGKPSMNVAYFNRHILMSPSVLALKRAIRRYSTHVNPILDSKFITQSKKPGLSVQYNGTFYNLVTSKNDTPGISSQSLTSIRFNYTGSFKVKNGFFTGGLTSDTQLVQARMLSKNHQQDTDFSAFLKNLTTNTIWFQFHRFPSSVMDSPKTVKNWIKTLAKFLGLTSYFKEIKRDKPFKQIIGEIDSEVGYALMINPSYFTNHLRPNSSKDKVLPVNVTIYLGTDNPKKLVSSVEELCLRNKFILYDQQNKRVKWLPDDRVEFVLQEAPGGILATTSNSYPSHDKPRHPSSGKLIQTPRFQALQRHHPDDATHISYFSLGAFSTTLSAKWLSRLPKQYRKPVKAYFGFNPIRETSSILESLPGSLLTVHITRAGRRKLTFTSSGDILVPTVGSTTIPIGYLYYKRKPPEQWEQLPGINIP
ncbi:MAG: hypothetical protein ABEJ65_09260 [bacterium]